MNIVNFFLERRSVALKKKCDYYSSKRDNCNSIANMARGEAHNSDRAVDIMRKYTALCIKYSKKQREYEEKYQQCLSKLQNI